MTRDGVSILERTSWEMIFGSEEVLPVFGFSKMVTKMRIYLTLDDDDSDADFTYSYRDVMINMVFLDVMRIFSENYFVV